MSAIAWKDQYKHPNWQRKRLEALNAAEYVCSRCYGGDCQLHVHHKRYVKGRLLWEYEVSELSVLCEECHTESHYEKDIFSELTARISAEGFGDLCAVAVGYVSNAQGPARANVDDLKGITGRPVEEMCGELSGVAWRLGIHELQRLIEFLSTSNPGESITVSIPISKPFDVEF